MEKKQQRERRNKSLADILSLITFLTWFQVIHNIFFFLKKKVLVFNLPMTWPTTWTNFLLTLCRQGVVIYALKNMDHWATVTWPLNEHFAWRAVSRMASLRAVMWAFRLSFLSIVGISSATLSVLIFESKRKSFSIFTQEDNEKLHWLSLNPVTIHSNTYNPRMEKTPVQ